ncbi:MAG: UDP-N-acetylmuramoyl-tripeptide--D-alanyl-D-alanine ligase [Clostridiales bacterium]|jgi:UDP-N-acetylmuramoyl-tripeptide--D-alanyl-D-alanine ligase|nr:UDP-N-acetylmuramoyl-tripeptide--D-alanyl-D-alanine ligase [Clostridiales bacterium]
MYKINLNLKEIIDCTKAKVIYKKEIKDILNKKINHVNLDTRNFKKNDVFIALKGNNFDGHDFLEQAAKKNAIALISSVKKDFDAPVLLVKNTLNALQKIAKYYKSKTRVLTIAITGSNGKTTTREILSKILSLKYKVCSSKRNFNNHIGLPISILEINKRHTAAIFELGMNHENEIDLLTKIALPDVAIITNIGTAHIGLLGSKENILKSKLEIINGLKKDGLLILNSDDEFLYDKIDFKKIDQKIIFCGLNNKKDNFINATNIKYSENLTSFDIEFKNKKYKFSIDLLGEHNVKNFLLAVSCGLKFGVNLEDICNIKKFKSIEMRCEIENINKIKIIKDFYNASPESMVSALSVLNNFDMIKKRKKIAILGEMLELNGYDKIEHQKISKLTKKLNIDAVFFVGKNFQEFKKNNEKSFCFETKTKLIDALKDFIKKDFFCKNDIILIKGSRGMHMEEVFEFIKKCC